MPPDKKLNSTFPYNLVSVLVATETFCNEIAMLPPAENPLARIAGLGLNFEMQEVLEATGAGIPSMTKDQAPVRAVSRGSAGR